MILYNLLIVWVGLLALGFLAPVVSPEGVKELGTDEALFVHNDPVVTHKIEWEVIRKLVKKDTNKVKTKNVGKIGVALFGRTVPYTVNNMVHLFNRTYGYGFDDKTTFHRIIKDFMVQTGDFQYHDGTGSYSIYNSRGKFKDENFLLLHDKYGRLSMANSGPNTNKGQFFITTDNTCPWLDGSYVVFGQVISGFDVLDALNNARTDKTDKPKDDFVFGKINIEVLDPTFEQSYDWSNVNDIGTFVSISYPRLSYEKFIIFISLSGLLWLLRRFYYARQARKDLEDSSYY